MRTLGTTRLLRRAAPSAAVKLHPFLPVRGFGGDPAFRLLVAAPAARLHPHPAALRCAPRSSRGAKRRCRAPPSAVGSRIDGGVTAVCESAWLLAAEYPVLPRSALLHKYGYVCPYPALISLL